MRAALWIGIGTILLALAAGLWFYNQTNSLVEAGHKRAATLLAAGLASALETELITRNYAELETRLNQALANEQVLAALVADNQGKVLAHMQRSPRDGMPVVTFEPATVTLPLDPARLEHGQGFLRSWTRIEPGVQLGWLRLDLSTTSADQALTSMRHQTIAIFSFASVVLLSVLGLVLHQTYVRVWERESSLLETQSLLENAAFHDPLTGLPNRHLLMDHLPLAMAYSQRHGKGLGVCFLDLDGFKQINDAHGHAAGDHLLVEIAHRLKRCLRPSDTVARLGGDEFVLLLADVGDEASCEEILQRVLRAIRQPVLFDDRELQVRTSIGITLYPADDSPADVLLEHADQAMYSAKREGKNRWHLYRAVSPCLPGIVA